MDDIAALLMGKDLALKKLSEEVEKKGLKLSVTEYGKEGKSKMIALWFLGNELRQCSKEEGVTMQGVVKKLESKKKLEERNAD